MPKPELLLPVGNIEAFYAALQGGTDAIYCGLKNFNARGRAANFTPHQLLQMVHEAKAKNVKVYVTLNTVIKNNELGTLLDVLAFLSKSGVTAVIIQDWGTFYLIKQHFKNLVVHASTQMANHNSAGLAHCKKAGFERVILARELTLPEITAIQKKAPIETEIFVHGALCYSFSGMCHFSSFIGGAGANRGLCTQPCRRIYKSENQKFTPFSLKDNQLIDFVPEFSKLGISSLKVEGRLKSGEYVYKVARAYRSVIDQTATLNQAQNALETDFGRQKTQWFYGHKVVDAITDTPATGVLLGTIVEVKPNGFSLKTTLTIETGARLRVRTQNDTDQSAFKVSRIDTLPDETVFIYTETTAFKPGMEVYQAGTGQFKFSDKLTANVPNVPTTLPDRQKQSILKSLRQFETARRELLLMRVNTPDWFKFLAPDSANYFIVNFRKSQLEQLLKKDTKWFALRQKIWVELPQFISEKNVPFYRNLCQKVHAAGYAGFSLSHLSQKELLPANANFGTNENVYCFNDAAANYLASEGAVWNISPFENEYENLITGANRNLIVPVYYYPRLFYSRQPVKTADTLADTGSPNQYKRTVINGITHILPTNPVGLTQYHQKLQQKGFNLYLIDLSFEQPDAKTLQMLLSKFKASEKVEPSVSFNFKKGMR